MDALLNLRLILLIITIVGNILLALAVMRVNSKDYTNITYVFLNLLISLWLIILYASNLQELTNHFLLISRLSIFVATPLSAAFFLFAHTLPSPNILLSKKKKIIVLSLTIAVMAVTLTKYTFTKVIYTSGAPEVVSGPGMGIFGTVSISFSTLAVYILYKKLGSSEGEEKLQFKYIMIGILTMLGLVTLTIFFPVLFFQYHFFISLAPLYSLIFLGMTAYAIVRHNLFDLGVIATEAITIILWVVLFSKIFVSASLEEKIVDTLVFLTTLVFGILLIRTVRKEFDQRQELEILTERLQELSARKDEFISVAAHELRAPMTAIKGYLSMIQEGDAGKTTPKVMEFLASAGNANERLIRLVNNMLDVARIEEGRQTYEMGIVNLSEVAGEAIVSFEELAKEKNLSLNLEIQENIIDQVEVDKDRIHEVVTNLVSNAIKYTDTGAVVVRLKNNTPATVYFEVADTGAGLSNEEQEKLFTKFYRAESNTGKVMGTGLGLYVSKLLIEKFGGKIGVVSERRKGSTFWFELPVKQ